ncbi:N-acetylglucosamine kinase [Candidatus Amoebophilus asiaticus]|nr:N-acetylglucosamine kinase [Candidatus Amoebophilus asiaticus]
MILIADSGSTKTDWRLIDEKDEIHQFKTNGLNPYIQSEEDIADSVKGELGGKVDSAKIEQVYFYGAGCSTEKLRAVIENVLNSNFPGAKIKVEHDLLGAARALFNKEAGIAAILGTGANSCVYDGEKIIEHIPATGYVLGDEGSGADIGKSFLKAFIQNGLPEKLKNKFIEKFDLDTSSILENVYRKDLPNRFLASFSHFLFQNINDQYVVDLISNRFSVFFDSYICKYSKYKERTMCCVGSVGYYFSNILRGVALEKDINLHRIIETPIAGLTLYHVNKPFLQM